MVDKILVALDRDDSCRRLYDQAVALAQSTQASLMLLSVLTPDGDGSLAIPSFSGSGYYPISMDQNLWEVYTERYREYEMAGLRQLRSFTDSATAVGVQTEFTQVSGNPGPAICKLAKTWNADLIMVGSHGRKGLNEMLMGSVSNYVVHHAPCSVLVVHKSNLTDTNAPKAELADIER